MGTVNCIMKQKTVEYLDMFNPAETIVAPNKLLSWIQLSNYHIKEYVHLNTREAAQHKKCRCHHPNFINGTCHYRTCNHDEGHHN